MKKKLIDLLIMFLAALTASIPLKFLMHEPYKKTLLFTLIVFAFMYVIGIILIPWIMKFFNK